MKKMFILTMAVCFVVAGWVPADAQETKIAIVNMELVMKAYPETQSSRLILEQQLEEFETEQKEMLKDLEALSKEFKEVRDQSRNTALSEEAREKNRVLAESKLEELRQRENEVKETAALRRKQLQDQQMRMRRRIIDKLRGIIAGYCEQNKIDLALDGALPEAAGAEAVVYCAKKLDITEAILGLIKKEPASGE
jgi:Skp family chaperone for outer membrane proteins